MDIITIIHNYLPHILVVSALAVGVGAWKLYQTYVRNKFRRMELLHFKKMAGNISQAEREYLDANRGWKKVRTRKNRHALSFSFFSAEVQSIISRFNPFTSIHNELEKLKGSIDSVRRNANLARWDHRDRIVALELQLNPPEEVKKEVDEDECALTNVEGSNSQFA